MRRAFQRTQLVGCQAIGKIPWKSKILAENVSTSWKRCSSLPALLEPDTIPNSIQIVQNSFVVKGIGSAPCLEMYLAPDITEQSAKDLAECLAMPWTDDKNLSEIVQLQAEVDYLGNRWSENSVIRRKRTLSLWVSKNKPKGSPE